MSNISKNQKKIFNIRFIKILFAIVLFGALVAAACLVNYDFVLKISLIILSAAAFVLCMFEIFAIIEQIIYYDSLTEIPNRNYIAKQLQKKHSQNKLYQYSVFFINLKDCRFYNQIYGASKTDEILISYAQILFEYAESSHGICARIGGDNFVVVTPNYQSKKLLDFIQGISIEIEVEGQKIKRELPSRVGITNLANYTSPHNVILHSTLALIAARQKGVDYEFFSTDMLDSYTKERNLVEEIKQALKNDEFIPYYQPLVNSKSHVMSGAEALARWVKGDALIEPEDFIPIMERNGLIEELDLRIFAHVCQDICDWQDGGLLPVCVSTNFSKKHLTNPDFVKRLKDIKNHYEVPDKFLEIEITEASNVKDMATARKLAAELKESDMKLAIDGFDTGFASLSMLNQFEIDEVKINKSFLDHCFEYNDKGKQFLIDTINIVKNQGVKIVFEGVETKEQYEFLAKHNCDFIQGFFFAPPLTSEDFKTKLMNPKFRT